MNNSLIPDLPQILLSSYSGLKSKFIVELRGALPRHQKREKLLKGDGRRLSEVLSIVLGYIVQVL